MPGVTSVGVNSGLPPIGNWNMPVRLPAMPSRTAALSCSTRRIDHLSPRLRPRASGGRFFSEQEVNARIHSAAVNQAFVKAFLPGRSPGCDGPPAPPAERAANFADDSFQIIGVLKDSVNRVATHETSPEIYIPFTVAAMSDRLYVSAQCLRYRSTGRYATTSIRLIRANP